VAFPLLTICGSPACGTLGAPASGDRRSSMGGSSAERGRQRW
jgi:hypothetical protein